MAGVELPILFRLNFPIQAAPVARSVDNHALAEWVEWSNVCQFIVGITYNDG